jgi:hypothetical protein
MMGAKKRRPAGRLFCSGVRVSLYLGIDSLFEDNLLVFLELITVFKALVFILADQLTTYARALYHCTVPPLLIGIMNPVLLKMFI